MSALFMLANLVQVMYQGATARSLPCFKGWLWSFTDNYCGNIEKSKRLPASLKLSVKLSVKAIILLDCWPVSIYATFRDWLDAQYPLLLKLYAPPR
jgi:hypothetical protein